eukprot:gene48744-59685_t
MGGVEGFAGEGGDHDDLAKASVSDGGFAGLQQQAADAAAGPAGMDKEGADARGVTSRIEVVVLALAIAIATVDGLSAAPAAAGDELVLSLDDEVGAVLDQVAVDTEDGTDGGLHLRFGVPGGLQAADGEGDQGLERGYVTRGGHTKLQGRLHEA